MPFSIEKEENGLYNRDVNHKRLHYLHLQRASRAQVRSIVLRGSNIVFQGVLGNVQMETLSVTTTMDILLESSG